MPCGCRARAAPPSWYRPRRKVLNPISTNPDQAAHSGNGRGDGPRRRAKKKRENNLLCRADHGHEPHPLPVIRHRDQFLLVSAPVHEAGHAEERPADLAQDFVTVPAKWMFSTTARSRVWACLDALTIFVEPDGWHGRHRSRGNPPGQEPRQRLYAAVEEVQSMLRRRSRPGGRRAPDVICQTRVSGYAKEGGDI